MEPVKAMRNTMLNPDHRPLARPASRCRSGSPVALAQRTNVSRDSHANRSIPCVNDALGASCEPITVSGHFLGARRGGSPTPTDGQPDGHGHVAHC